MVLFADKSKLPQTPPASKQSSLERISEDRPKETPHEVSEISEDIPTEGVTGADSVSGLDLRLRLDHDEVDLDRGTTPTPRSGYTDTRPPDSARSLSEIPEEYTQSVNTARSETEAASVRGHSARSAYTEDAESRSEQSDVSHRSNSSASKSTSKTYSEDTFESSRSTTQSRSETAPAAANKKDLMSKTKSVTEQEDSIEESIQTEGDISDIESDADNKGLFFDLKEDNKDSGEKDIFSPEAKHPQSQEPGHQKSVSIKDDGGNSVLDEDNSAATDSGLLQITKDVIPAAEHEGSGEKPARATDSLVNKLTNEFMQGVIEDSVDTMQNIRAKSPVTDMDVDVDTSPAAAKTQSPQQKDQTLEVVTQNMLNEAVTHMLNIRKRKKDSIQQTDDLEQVSADKLPRKTGSIDDGGLFMQSDSGKGDSLLGALPSLTDSNAAVLSKVRHTNYARSCVCEDNVTRTD